MTDRRLGLTRPQWAVSIGLALALVGFVTAAQWNSSAAREQFTTSAQQVLTAQAVGLQAEQEELRRQIGEEEGKVADFQERGEGSLTELEQLNRQVLQARLAAGLSEVRGPGAVIEIADSLRAVAAGDSPTNYIVLVDDVRDIVAALWASGAQAVAINGERLVATSSIYGVGASILVNTAFLSPPFQVQAVGPPGLHDAFLAHPAFMGRVGQRITAYGLEFASEPRDEVVLQAFIGSTSLRWAVPVGAD